MSITPASPSPASSGALSPADAIGGVVQGGGEGDFVLAGRHISAAQHIADLMVAGELKTAGTPRKLPHDLFPDVDPVVVQEIWNRAAAVVWQAARYAAAPRFYRDELARLQGQLQEAGFAAMGGMVARTVRLVDPAAGRGPVEGLAVDEESAREH